MIGATISQSVATAQNMMCNVVDGVPECTQSPLGNRIRHWDNFAHEIRNLQGSNVTITTSGGNSTISNSSSKNSSN